MHVNARGNEYQEQMGHLFDEAPKAVIAAVAVSLIKRLAGDGHDAEHGGAIQASFLAEWSILHDNGIVSQRPPRASLPRRSA